ncbi:MAG: transporter [Gemmatimonadota bacterium]
MNAILHILWLSLIPVAATGLGAVVAVLRPPGARVKSGIQHFAGGVVFAVVAVELLPDVVRTRTPVEVVIGFAAGIGLMLLLRRWTDSAEKAPDPSNESSPKKALYSIPEQTARAASGEAPTGLLVAVGIDILLDGLLLGIAFAAGAKEGLLLTLALSLELLSLSLAITASLLDRSASRTRAVVVPVLLSLLLCVGAIVGDTVLHNASPAVLAAVLSFGCAALLFLVTEELLVEAHEVPETPGTTAMFFAGFLLFLVLGMIG